jgi:hypothetical protein
VSIQQHNFDPRERYLNNLKLFWNADFIFVSLTLAKPSIWGRPVKDARH